MLLARILFIISLSFGTKERLDSQEEGVMGAVDPMELVYSLIGFPDETEWIEFKESSNDPEEIGKDISALANAAAYHGKDFAYKLWGVRDKDHRIVGTSFFPLRQKAKGNQDLQIWLQVMLTSNANFEFEEIERDGIRLVVLRICAASGQPVCFSKSAYIRIGSSTTKLQAGSAREAELWRRLQRTGFETRAAIEDVGIEDIPLHLNIDAYYELNGARRPASLEGITTDFSEQELIKKQDNGLYSITNLGALLIGKKLSLFASLQKRSIRIVRYAGNGNFEIIEDRVFDEGYALALQHARDYIASLTAVEEVLDGSFRKTLYEYPLSAVRELLANMVTHQDLTATSSGPFVGVYGNRIEFSNPGASLIPVERVLNAQPKTRNNKLVGCLRLMDLCEEGGTGWDLCVDACERRHMPAPKMETSEELGTKVVLFCESAYARMKKRERMDASYWHACLKYAQGDSMSNRSLRERFGIGDDRKDTLAMSRLIKDCCEAEMIKEEDPEAGTRYKRYIPFWA